MMNEDYLLTAQIETHVKLALKPLHEKVVALQDEVTSLKSELVQTRQAIQSFRAQQSIVQAPPMQPQYGQQAQTVQQQYPPQQYEQTVQSIPQYQQQEQPRQPSNQPIDRNGVAPSSVSIEKFFYAGNKR
ncbi:MAG: hypothetical protein ABIA93_02020 [Candidatus Woesearchaeota archaeon]